jgi:predicted RNA-binding Zn-ribbon protein involved in translation (DUF1610 family)
MPRHGQHDRAIYTALSLVAVGTVGYRVIPLFEPGRGSFGVTDVVAPLVWVVPIGIAGLVVRRQTVRARLADGLCARCERGLSDLERALDEACPRCGLVNRRVVKRWLIRTGGRASS